MEMESLGCLYKSVVTAQWLFVEAFYVLHAL